MQVGAATVDITPPLPMDLLGHVRRAVAAREVSRPLQARACLLRDETTTVVIVTLDLAGMSPAFADGIREAVAAAVGGRAADVLVNCSHTHAAPWPDAANKMGGEIDGWSTGRARVLGVAPRSRSPRRRSRRRRAPSMPGSRVGSAGLPVSPSIVESGRRTAGRSLAGTRMASSTTPFRRSGSTRSTTP